MKKTPTGLLSALGCILLATTSPALAADVTPERLVNADKVPLGGGAGNEFNEATPLAEDGFLYVTDSWGVLYKIDARSGDVGRIVWRMDPKQERQQANRGAALWGNLVITPANGPARMIATDKETGKVVWETNVAFGAARMNNTGAPLVIKNKVLFGAAGSDAGWRGWIAALDAATGKREWLTYPAMIMEGGLPNYFTINGKSFPATETITVKKGERVRLRLIGIGQFVHPMHLHGVPFKIVATDGHPVPEAAQLTKDTVSVAPGERYDIEFVASEPGQWMLHCHILHHTTNDNVEPGGLMLMINVVE